VKIEKDVWYRPEQLAEHWQIEVSTLEFWRSIGRYPALTYSKIGGSVRYSGEVIIRFESQNPADVRGAKYVPKNPTGPRDKKSSRRKAAR